MVSALLLGVAPGVRPEPAQMCARNRWRKSLLARTIQAKDDAGSRIARVVWGGVGWGFQR